MPDRTSYAPGTPSWVDIGTDLDHAIPFSTGLFGWEADRGDEEMGGYGFFQDPQGAVFAIIRLAQ